MAKTKIQGQVAPKTHIAKAYGKLFKYMKKYVFVLILAFAFSLGGALASLLGPGRISDITNYIQAGLGGSAIDTESAVRLCFVCVGIYSAGLICNFLQGQVMAIVAQKLTKDMRNDYLSKVNALPLSFFDAHSTGDTLSLVTNDIDTINSSMNQSFSSLINSFCLLFGSMVVMLLTNWIMALSGIAAALLGFIIMMVVLSKSQKHFAAQQDVLGLINGHVEETFSGFQVIKVYNGEKQNIQRMETQNGNLYKAAWKSQFYSGLMMPFMIFVGNLAYVVVCIVGGILAISNIIQIGVIVAFMMYIRLFTQPLQNISQAASSLSNTAAACERVFAFLEEKEMEEESNKPDTIGKDGEQGGNVDFEHVCFGYSKDKIIIHDFSQKATFGQKIAIVGPTGAGKTTMVNLLMRFYEIDDGAIYIDGTNIAEVKRTAVHDRFSMVLQETWLFEGTLRENLVYNREGITDERLNEVCASCGLTDLVEQLKDGYDTILDDSAGLSQGQRQLITIARAMLKDAPLLILDEATSSVDTRTELLVQEAMDKLTEGRTSFVIAHRLSTIKNADCILVMKDGDVIESGNHEELMAKGGFYADLYNSQFDNA